jgi:hypothetical protein
MSERLLEGQAPPTYCLLAYLARLNNRRLEGAASEEKIGQRALTFKAKKSGWFVSDPPPSGVLELIGLAFAGKLIAVLQ